MGTTADNMKKSDGKPLDSVKDIEIKEEESVIEGLLKGLFGGFLQRKLDAKVVKDENPARTFADMIDKADELLETLRKRKALEFQTETSDVRYNKLALASLDIMRGHLDKLIDEMIEYSNLRKR